MSTAAEFLVALRWQQPPLIMTALIIAVALLAGRSTFRQWQRHRTAGAALPTRRNLTRIILVLAGPVVICAAQLVSHHLVFPAVHAVVWPPFTAAFGLEDGAYNTHVGFWVWPIEDVLAGMTSSMISVAAAGWLTGRALSVGPLDGFWLANPLSILGGHLLCHWLFDDGGVLWYWGLTMWGLRAVAMCPLYAWLFYAAATLAGKARRPGGGLTRA